MVARRLQALGERARAHDAPGMFRRTFLGWASAAAGAALAPACATPAARATAPALPQARAPRAICFDLFTLFDPRSVNDVVKELVPNGAAEFAEAWRSRQFQYAFLRAAAGQYADFRRVTEDALVHAAAAREIELSAAARNRLVDAYSELEPWPDSAEALARFRSDGLRLAPLANYSPAMLERLLDHAGLRKSFDLLISTDLARTFKPHPGAYALGVERLGFPKEQIVFAAFGGWDAAGAKWFGYPTFWVNRLAQPEEQLAPGPDASGPTLAELSEFVRGLTRTRTQTPSP
jgi:2-haloacid dehalogenase